jgi:hypothetical protein
MENIYSGVNSHWDCNIIQGTGQDSNPHDLPGMLPLSYATQRWLFLNILSPALPPPPPHEKGLSCQFLYAQPYWEELYTRVFIVLVVSRKLSHVCGICTKMYIVKAKSTIWYYMC